MRNMDLGKKFIVEVQGASLSKTEIKQIKELQPAGFMLRKRNFLAEANYATWFREYKSLISKLQSLIERPKMILCIDHEGGQIIRPPEPITRFPYPSSWGNSDSEVVKAIATELESLGINLNFGPVADINSNPKNPVIGQRAFGEEPQGVIKRNILYQNLMRKVKIASCAKHFPGHGDTSSDSHLQLPILNKTYKEIKDFELLPFAALIKNSIPAIMPGHLSFPKIDPDNFSTCSKIILKDILRKKMGFKGVIISDALSMAPAKEILLNPELLIKAMLASLDILTVAGPGLEIDKAMECHQILLSHCEKNQRLHRELISSNHRIDLFLKKLRNPAPYKLDRITQRKHQSLQKLLSLEQSRHLKDCLVTQ